MGFHPIAFEPLIQYYKELKKYSNVQTILWQDDLHAFFKTEESRKNRRDPQRKKETETQWSQTETQKDRKRHKETKESERNIRRQKEPRRILERFS